MDLAEKLYTTYRQEALRKQPDLMLAPWRDLGQEDRRPWFLTVGILKLSPVVVAAEALNLLSAEATAVGNAHGFTEASVGEDVALITSEASELLEDHREGHDVRRVWFEEKVAAYGTGGDRLQVDGKPAFVAVRHGEPRGPGGELRKPCGIPSEAADIVIRVMHFCGKHGIDLGAAVREKMIYNASRPFKHGGKTL
jgi:hypothetical protein